VNTPDDPERLAFYAAIEANPEDFLTYGVFADWLEDRGEVELAEGMRAMMRLRVTVIRSLSYRRFAPLDTFGDDEESIKLILERRANGGLHFVTDAWRSSSRYIDTKDYPPPFGVSLTDAALAYSRLTADQKMEAERLLAPAEGELPT